MVRIHATSVAAQVIKNHPFWDGTDEKFVHHAVSTSMGFCVKTEATIAIHIMMTKPVPAKARGLDLLKNPFFE